MYTERFWNNFLSGKIEERNNLKTFGSNETTCLESNNLILLD